MSRSPKQPDTQTDAAIQQTQAAPIKQRRLAELHGLADIAVASATLTDPDETLRCVTRTVARLLSAEQCVLVGLSQDLGQAYAESPGYGFQLDQLRRVRFETTPEMIAWFETAGQETLILDDLDAPPLSLANLGRQPRSRGATLLLR